MKFSYQLPDDEQLHRCWKQQNCGGCLDEDHCSWCPFTQSCVPNNYAIPALAPAYNEDICPHWAERWEIRTRPLGCYVSTVTILTCIISVVSTLGVILMLYLTVLLVRRLQALHKRNPEWWKTWLNGCRVRMTRLKARTIARRRSSGTREEEAALLAP